jgi:SAM-dependent methyltransferase
MSSQPWGTGDRVTLRVLFDEDPVAYDRARPVAPDFVFDEVVGLAGLGPGSTVVEVGPGTGQATRPLAERGLRIVALEPGRRLAARARENLAGYPSVEVRGTSFEEWDSAGRPFDAVFACNSFHWVDPAVRFSKAAAVLSSEGRLVVMTTPVVVPAGATRFWWDVQEDWAAVGAATIDPAGKHPDLVGDLAQEVRASGLFTEPAVLRRGFDVALTAEQYAPNLSTQSAVKQLPADARRELLSRVRHRVMALGGNLTVHHLVVSTIAQRR